MEKAKHPTSNYKVACDHFDTFATAEIHQTEDGLKMKLTLESESGGEPLSISLFREDVEMMSRFMRNVAEYVNKRPQG